MIIGMRSGHKNSLGADLWRMANWTWTWLWGHRVEIGLLAFVFAVAEVGMLAPWFIYAPIWLAMLCVVAYRPTGRKVFGFSNQMLNGSKVRRQLERAARDSGFPGLKAGRVAATLPGEMIDVTIPRGQTVARLDATKDAMAACMRVGDVRVIHDREDRSRAQISVIRRNPFLTMDEMEWPLLNAESVDIRKGIPIGRDEYGRMVDARLLSRNLILGGSPDAGKSTALRVYAAAAALDPKVKLWMMDAKTEGAEFVHWVPAAKQVVRGRKLEEAVEMLAKIEEGLDQRSREIVARGEVFVCADMELDVLMIDELPQFMRVKDTDSKEEKKHVESIQNGIWRLIALGRWAGMMTILSAQKPTANVVPTESRDLIDNKFALHCNTKSMSRAITGSDSDEDAPADATTIPSGQPGVGFYIGDQGVTKMRHFYISHKQAMELATRIASRRMDDELAAL
jgi:hypothetical protein